MDQCCLALLAVTTAVLELGVRAQAGDLSARAQVEALAGLLAGAGLPADPAWSRHFTLTATDTASPGLPAVSLAAPETEKRGTA